MKLSIPKGRYVVAVSGGVDSMALLHALAQKRHPQPNSNIKHRTSNIEFIVAHFNHGIRPDAGKDEELVRRAAEKYGRPFEAGYGRLGLKASEEQARVARYRFLSQVKQKYQADAIMTAHHQGDLIETAILNLLRGSGRRGLTAITDNPNLIRPLLPFSKQAILAYARRHNLKWREDPSNDDENYLRNFVRRQIVPKLSRQKRQQFLAEIQKLSNKNKIINQEIENLSQNIIKGKSIQRAAFTALPMEIAREVLMYFLRQNHIRQFDKKTIERLVVAVKTAKPGTKHDIVRARSLELTTSQAILNSPD